MKSLSDLTGNGGVPRWAGYRYRTQEVERLEDIHKIAALCGIFYS